MKKQKFWAIVHWLGAIHRVVKTEKEAVQFCEKNNFNKNSPIYLAVPLHGVEMLDCSNCKGTGKVLTAIKSTH